MPRLYAGPTDGPIYKVLQERGVSIAEAARQIGISIFTLQRVLHGKAAMRMSTMALISDWSGIPAEDLMLISCNTQAKLALERIQS